MSLSTQSQTNPARPNAADARVLTRSDDGTVAAEAWLAATVLIAALAVFSLGALSWIV